MKVFVTGVGGQLGYDVVCGLRSRGIDCVGTDILDAWVDTIEDDIKNNLVFQKIKWMFRINSINKLFIV